MFIERDSSQMKSLQHRLEQLVAVHRQLLRKYGSLEIECGEMRKKLDIRDSRIKQLEGTNRGVSVALRQQAERHAAELTNLCDQVQMVCREVKVTTSPTNKSQNDHTRSTGPRTIRGGGGVHSTPRGASFDGDDPNFSLKKSSPANSTGIVTPVGGFLSRLGLTGNFSSTH